MPDKRQPRKISKIILIYVDGSQKELTGAVVNVLAPVLVNADKLLTDWEYPVQLVMQFSYDPSSGTARASVKAES